MKKVMKSMTAREQLMQGEDWLFDFECQLEDAEGVYGAEDVVATLKELIETTKVYIEAVRQYADQEAEEEAREMNREYEAMVF